MIPLLLVKRKGQRRRKRKDFMVTRSPHHWPGSSDNEDSCAESRSRSGRNVYRIVGT